MIRSMPGVFCAGEMLDWEAPTGGYLLTACFAMGRAAGLGVLARLNTETVSNLNGVVIDTLKLHTDLQFITYISG